MSLCHCVVLDDILFTLWNNEPSFHAGARRRAPHDATTAKVKSIQLVHDDWSVDAIKSPGEGVQNFALGVNKTRVFFYKGMG